MRLIAAMASLCVMFIVTALIVAIISVFPMTGVAVGLVILYSILRKR